MGKQIKGSWGGSSRLDYDIYKFYDIIKKSKINLDEFVSKIYNFNKINDAIKDFKSGQVIRPIIKF